MTTRQISVVVPLYNVATYMPGLITTLKIQNPDLIEVVFVNDGSTDDTLEKLEAALQANPLEAPWRIISKPNGGLSDARNAGIKATDLPYLAFLDPDDEISPDFYGTLYRRLKDTGSDMVISSSVEVWWNGKRRNAIYAPAVHEKADSTAWLPSYDWSACTKLFARSLFDDAEFDVGIRYEDLSIVPYFMATAGRFCTSDTAIYYYYRREGSITLEGTFELENRIFDSTDLVAQRLKSLGKDVLAWTLLQKVLVTGFVPTITLRYSREKSRQFALKSQAYLRQHNPGRDVDGFKPRKYLTKLFLRAPRATRWMIAGLYKVATLGRT